MSIGSVTIDDNGNASGSGTALDLYNEILALETAASPLPDPNTPDSDWDGTAAAWKAEILPLVVKIKRAWARQATEHATILGTGEGLSLNAPASTTSASLVATNLTFPVKSGEIWAVEVDGTVQCSSTGGVALGLSGPAGSTAHGYVDGAYTSSLAWTSAALTALGTPTGVLNAAAGASRAARLRATVTAGADGNVTFQFAAVVAGQTATIDAGTMLRARRLTGA